MRNKILSEHMLNDEAPLPIMYVSRNNTVSLNGHEYSLNSLNEYSIRSPGFVHTVDGKEAPTVPQGLLWKGQGENGASVLLVRNENGTPNHIAIKDGDSMTSLCSMPGDSSGAMVAISAADYDYDLMNSMYRYGEDVQVSVEGRGTYNDNPDGIRRALHALDAQPSKQRSNATKPANLHRQLQGCGSFTAMEVAVVYDSSFCSQNGGTPEGAQGRVEAIVAMASQHYEVDGLCITLQISNLEGYCDSATDIYRDVIQSPDLLGIFQNHWNSDRQDRPRDAAHLFTGTDFSSDGVIGVAFVGQVCQLGAAYGIDWMTFTDDLNTQALLFAHELGHNAGAPHLDGDTGNIMNPVINGGENGFGSSINDMNGYLGTQSCLSNSDQSGSCGNGSRGDGVCADGTCCSQWGWCGTSAEHCEGGDVTPPTSEGTCGNASRGDGVCADGTCCSQWGWCGTSEEHCSG